MSKLRILEEEILCLISKSTSIKHITQIHAKIFTLGFHQNNFIATKLLNLCSSTSSITHASLIFHHILNPTIPLWNSFIRALSQHHLPIQTLRLYIQLKHSRISPDNFTFPFVLKSCTALQPYTPLGKSIHGEVIRIGLDADPYIQSALIDMYSKCGHLDDALFVFEEIPIRDTVTWNSVIAGCFRRENVEKGRELFDQMPEKNVVSWNTVVTGYTQNGKAVEALNLFRRMQSDGVCPNEVTLISILSACAQAGAIEIGKWVHRYIKNKGIKSDVRLNNCLIDMYSKGGSIRDARIVFDGMVVKSVVSWNSMISSLAMHGCGEEAVSVFEDMRNKGVKPNDLTYIGVLSACSHARLVEQGRNYFKQMLEENGIAPKVEHYGCMVNLLGRGGYLYEAHELIKSIPFPADAGIWGALLSACQTHGHLELAENAAKSLLDLEPWNAGNYLLLSNLYAANGRWDEAENVRGKMKGRRVKKTPGSSSIEIGSSIHEFVAGTESHPCSTRIYGKLDELGMQLKILANMDSVLHDICLEDNIYTH